MIMPPSSDMEYDLEFEVIIFYESNSDAFPPESDETDEAKDLVEDDP